MVMGYPFSLCYLQTNKWGNLFDASIRLLDDTRYVLSHEEVSKHVAYERPDLTRSWIKLLSLVQGMDPQKRVTSIHAEDENENLSAPFVLGHYLGIVQNLMMRDFLLLINMNQLM